MRKDFKQLVDTGKATDISTYGSEELAELYSQHGGYLVLIDLSFDSCGVSGALLEDPLTGELFTVWLRTETLFKVL